MQHLLRTKAKRGYRGLIAAAAVFVALLAVFFVLLSKMSDGADAHGQALLERAIRRASVTCYAIEGRYPPDLDYLIDRYGVTVDFRTYAVRYEVFSENFMPDIAVIRKGGR